jgi:hypothetical protein
MAYFSFNDSHTGISILYSLQVAGVKARQFDALSHFIELCGKNLPGISEVSDYVMTSYLYFFRIGIHSH